MTGEITELEIADVAESIRNGELTAVEVTRCYLERIDRFNPVIDAYAHVAHEAALTQAKHADARRQTGESIGALHGVPVAIKGVIAVNAMPLTGGSRSRAGFIAARDAKCVGDLRRAGAIILGMLNTHELGVGRSNWKGPFPTGRNPWNLDHVTTGSSSGAGAAVAARLATGAIGTDTAGSVRLPAAHCGLTGLKPTFDRVSTDGMIHMCPSLDHIGPIGRSSRDVSLLMAALTADRGGGIETTSTKRVNLEGVKLGVLRRYYLEKQQVDEDVIRRFEECRAALISLGVTYIDIDVPLLDFTEAMYQAFMAEAYQVHARALHAAPELFEVGTRSQMYLGAMVSAADYLASERYRRAFRGQVDGVLREVDALIHPGQPAAAPVYSESLPTDVVLPRGRFTVPWNLTGHPALSIPTGFAGNGLPVSAQLVGRYSAEDMLLRIAQSYQSVTEWHRMRPDERLWIAPDVRGPKAQA